MKRPLCLLAGLIALATAFALSPALGATDIPLAQATNLLLRPNDSNESLVVHTLRLPRTLVALLAGAGLLLQAVTLGRSLIPPLEVPAGIFTTLVGAPYFLFLLRKTRG